MTESELRARIDAMVEAEYEALGGDNFRDQFGDEMVQKIVVPGLTKRLQAELARDAEFKAALGHDVAGQYLDEYIATRRPTGQYREDGLLRLDDKRLIEMPMATREHLIAWALNEDDKRNLDYIKSRLDLWEAYPECKTLGELEAVDG